MKTTGIFLAIISVMLVFYALNLGITSKEYIPNLMTKQNNLTIAGIVGFIIGGVMITLGYLKAHHPRKTIDE
ncbi:hypothetical protein BH10BAC5_BH10BAC5_20820 [soil metagenome]